MAARLDDLVEVRSRVLSLVSGAVAHAVRDRLVIPPLRWEDLPEDRLAASGAGARRRIVWHAFGVFALLAVLAAAFTWVGVPGEFATSVLLVLGGAVGVLLPWARWPR